MGAPSSNTVDGVQTGLVKLFQKTGGQWQAAGTLLGNDPLPGDAFGGPLAMEGTLLAVGVHQKKVQGPNATITGTGEVQLFRLQEGHWTFEAVLRPPPGVLAGTEFGRSVVVNGGRVLVGAPKSRVQSGPTFLNDAGRVFLFHQVDGDWSLAAEIPDPSPASNVSFGSRLAMEGGRVAVSRLVTGSFTNSWQVELFGELSEVWSHEARLTKTGVNFSGAFAMKEDRLAMAAPSSVRDSQTAAGNVYLFTRSSGGWDAGESLVPNHAAMAQEQFGWNLTWANESLVVSSLGQQSSNSPPRWTVFEMQADAWTAVASTVLPMGQYVIGMTSDDDTLLMTSPLSGPTERVRVLESENGSWSEVTVLGEEEDLNTPDLQLGNDLQTDGDWVMSRGRFFKLTGGALEPQPGLGAPPTWLRQGESYTVGAFRGNWLVATAPSARVETVFQAGKVAMYELAETPEGTEWQYRDLLMDPDVSLDGRFGESVVFLDDDTLAVGSPSTELPSYRVGLVHIYERMGSVWLLK